MHRSTPLRIARGVLLALALAGLLVTLVPTASGDAWWIRYLDFPRLEFLVAMIFVALLLALVPRTKLSFTAFFALAGAVAYDVSILLPYTTVVKTQEASAHACSEGKRLRLLEVNVEMTNTHNDRLLEIVKQVAPDVVWFQETDDWWAKELLALCDRMPYHVSKAQPNYFGVDLYSRFPLVDPQIKYLTGSANPSVFVGIRLPSGKIVKLYAIHPRPPQEGQSTAERDAQLLAAALAAHNDSEPHVIAGDMNSVPWEDSIHQAERVGRFLDPRIGRGLFITWNAKSWFMKWPLDQILPGPEFTLVSLNVLPAFGSDHRPYLVDLCLSPEAITRQFPPALQSDDIGSAQARVKEGQGKAKETGYKGRHGTDSK